MIVINQHTKGYCHTQGTSDRTNGDIHIKDRVSILMLLIMVDFLVTKRVFIRK